MLSFRSAGSRSRCVSNAIPAKEQAKEQNGNNKDCERFKRGVWGVLAIRLSHSKQMKRAIGVGEVASSNLVVPTIYLSFNFNNLAVSSWIDSRDE